RDDRGFNRDDQQYRDREDRYQDQNFNENQHQDYNAEAQTPEQLQENLDNQFEEYVYTIDGLPIPPGLEGSELDEATYRALGTLGEHNQERVGKLLVMAGQLIDLDPEQAYVYAQAAVKRAGRVDVVREAAALTAYVTGRYAEALREVRAVRRMRGDQSLRAVEADCERGLDKPDKALEIVEQTDMSALPLSEQVELVLVAAGARADMEEHDTALVLIEDALHKLGDHADDQTRRRLMVAQADFLRQAGREEEAAEVEARTPAEEEDNDIIDVQLFADADIDNRRSDLKGSGKAPAETYDTLLLDLDGVCYMGKNPVEHADTAVTSAVEAGMKQVFVTNNSSRTPEAIAQQLQELGIPAQAENIMTSAMDVIGIMEDKVPAGAKVFVIGGEGLRQALADAGYQVVESADDQPEAVVQGFDSSVDWAMLSEGALAITAGAQYFATNLDASLPVERGYALGNGALVRAVRYCTSRKPEAAGKPLPGIFHRAIEMVEGEKAIAVGDRLETDIAGAIAAGVPALHVLTGVHDAKAVVLADRGLRPQFVHTDMRGLNEPHPRPDHHKDGTWTCGVSQVAKVIAGHLSLDGVVLTEPTTVTLDSYRALIAAAWDWAADNPKVVCPLLTVVGNDDPEGIVTAPEPADEPETTENGEDEAVEAAQENTDGAEAEVEAVAEETVEADAAPAEVETAEDSAADASEEAAAEATATEEDSAADASEEAAAEATEEDNAAETAEDEFPVDADLEAKLAQVDVDNIDPFLPGEEDLQQLLEETKHLEDQ
ncbi:MAG: HAD-IIA family hydrolase, partial [Actinomycetaceae bacterium]|nr:HAD-IIA family hydrolase [Actinomycetaceae bacterium]